MNLTLTIRDIGNSEGVILPKELLARLRVKSGDKIYVTETPAGIAVQAHDPHFARAMELAEDVMREDRDVLRKLAE